jgi:hypothetical protein
MTQADYKIREALIALLCVGDDIQILTTNVNHFDIHQKVHRKVNMIETFTITKVLENKVELVVKRYSEHSYFSQDFYHLDEYKGRLIGWNIMGWYQDNEYEKRIKKLVEAIESKDTIWLAK